ncbi:HD domain-containing protein [Desulfuromonas carbonis]|uniref:HD domain-containing phosphohydrolase n=1 Tax=Desulfuromonas sp. DDH964 TaxID=1823759 RepID=UPI00078D234A|nr:HD domain-containing phosphohydrolase [Desulfuromonas sp. DDH964]AMV72805.1 sensor cyclic diguanylate phosphodiesterase, GAF and GAF domain-containing [Desulfuromonas sp. DDH964]
MLSRQEIRIPLADLIACLSDVIDLINPELVDHHKRVAYIACAIAREMGLGEEASTELLVAGKLHDIGALSLQERLRLLSFETESAQRHAEVGYLLLRDFAPFGAVAEIIRGHHERWGEVQGRGANDLVVKSQILHLADRVAVLTRSGPDALGQAAGIRREIEAQNGGVFHPEAVAAFRRLAAKDYFWLDIVSPLLRSRLQRRVGMEGFLLNLDGLRDLTRVFARVIDFRSPFTATHSSGVAACAETLARLCGWSWRECQLIQIAGFLHDLGKLGVPTEILEKPGPLSASERNIVRCHPFYTYRTLERIPDFAIINVWSSFHHECPAGQGYPFHVDRHDLPLGSRIMAVADVFTALAEDRPYRAGLAGEEILHLLREMAASEALDGALVALLEQNFTEVNAARLTAQSASRDLYQTMLEGLAKVA